MMHMTWPDDDSSNVIRPWAQRAQNLQRLPVGGGSEVAPHQLSDARRFHLLARIAPRRAPASGPVTPVPGSSTSTKTAASAAASAYILPSTSLTALQRATMSSIVPRWQQPTKATPVRSFPSLKPVGIIKPKGEHVFVPTPTRALGPFATVTFLSSADIDLEAGPSTPVEGSPRSPSILLDSSPESAISHRTDEPSDNAPTQPAAAAVALPELASLPRPKKQKQKKVKAAWKSAAFVLPEEGDTASLPPAPAAMSAPAAPELPVKSTKSKRAAKNDAVDLTKTTGTPTAALFDGEPAEPPVTVPPSASTPTQAVLLPSLDEAASVMLTNSATKLSTAWPRRTSNPPPVIPLPSRYADIVTSKTASARPSSPTPVTTSQALAETLSSSTASSATVVDREILSTSSQPTCSSADTSFSSSYESDYDEEDSVEIITHSSTVPTLSGSASASARASRGVSPERHSAQLPLLPPGLAPLQDLIPPSLAPRQNLQPRIKTPIAIIAPPLPAPSATSVCASTSRPAPRATGTATSVPFAPYVPRAFGSNPLISAIPSTTSDSTTSSERPSTPSLSSTSSHDHGETESQSRRDSISLASELLTPRDASPPRFGTDDDIAAKDDVSPMQLASAASHPPGLPTAQQFSLPHTIVSAHPTTTAHETVTAVVVPPTGPPGLPTPTIPCPVTSLVAAATMKAGATISVPNFTAPPSAPSSLRPAHQRPSQTLMRTSASMPMPQLPLLPPMQFASLADPTVIDYSVYTPIDGTQTWDLWPYGSAFVDDDTQRGLAAHDQLAHVPEEGTAAVDLELVLGEPIADDTEASSTVRTTLPAYEPPAPPLTEIPIEKRSPIEPIPPFLSTSIIMREQQPSPRPVSASVHVSVSMDPFSQRHSPPFVTPQPTGSLADVQMHSAHQFQRGYVHLPPHMSHSNYPLPSPPIQYSSEIMVSEHILHGPPSQALGEQGYHQPATHHYANYYGAPFHPQDALTRAGQLALAEGSNQYNYSVMMPSYPPGMQPWSLPPPAPMSASSSNPPTTSNTPAPVLQFGETTPTLVGSTTFSASPKVSMLPGPHIPPTGTNPESPELSKGVRFGQAAGEAMARSGSSLRERGDGGRGRGRGKLQASGRDRV